MSFQPQQIIGNLSLSNNNNSFNNVLNFVTETDAEGNQILQWLSPLEPQQRHQAVRADRLHGVGAWALETNEFIKWRDAEGGGVEQVLFCYGNPGVGKTYVSSLVIDNLCDRAEGKDIAVVGLYCDFLAQQGQSATNMVGAMLKQLATRGGITEYIREAFQKAKKEFGGRSLLLPDMVEILKKTIASLPRLFICIDALDECTPKHRRELLDSIRDIVEASPNTRVFLTGRPHINEEIVKYFRGAARIPLSPTHKDIRSYLQMKLDGDTDPSAMDDELRADIMRVIPEKISEIFLLVSLNIDALLGEITLHKRRRKLDEMTKGEGLGDAYAATLSRMRAQQRSRSKLGMEVLMWVSHAERPLHIDELCHALGAEEGSIDLNTRNIPAMETLLACSLGLVTVDKSSSTVRLIHYTLQQYLSQTPNLFLKPHSAIAEACLTYLNFPHVRGFSAALRSAPPTAPFVEYASCYWGVHAKRETTESVKTLALMLLDGYDKHISSKILLLHGVGYCDQLFDEEDTPRGFTGLHGAAYFGCVEIIVVLLETNKWDVQATDFGGSTAITWASMKGQEEVVRLLLARSDINPEKADKWGQTPLLLAAVRGYERVVKALLERGDVNPDIAGECGPTPLSCAAQSGHEGVVKMLLERNDVNPNTPETEYALTPLWWAARNGREGIVRMLLERGDVNPDTADTEYGQTPLWWAAKHGHDGIARLLLERNDVSPDKADQQGRTPLMLAAESGYEGVVRMLLGRSDVNPDETGGLSRAPLLLAAKSGHEGIVGRLLERSDVNPDKGDELNRTPLLWAAKNGHEGVVKGLLERSDVNPDISDIEYGRTPLWWAAANGHEGIARLLLQRNDLNPDKADKWSQTSLLWAAGNGHEGVVRMLLERNDVNPDTPDTLYRRTPLLCAAKNGHGNVVRILLERSDINPNTADTAYGRTPLLWAAENGHYGVVRMLLERGDINPNTADTTYGRTLLLWGAENGHEGIVRTLLDREDINPDTADTESGRTPLLWAAENGHPPIVRMLLEREDVDPNTADTECGRTPLLWAAKNGHENIVRMLLERNDVNPDTADTECGRTPLLWAAKNGHENIVKMLLKRNDVSPDRSDKRSRTWPLLAPENGLERITKLPSEPTDLIPTHEACLQLTELSSSDESISEPPSKRVRRC